MKPVDLAEIVRDLPNPDFAFREHLDNDSALVALRCSKLALRRRPIGRQTFDYSGVERAVALLKALPSRGESIHCLMNTAFNTYDLIEAVVRMAGRPCRHLMVTTLGTNLRAAVGFEHLLKNHSIERLTLYLSRYFQDADRATCRDVVDRLKRAGAAVFVARVHCKLLLFNFGNTHYVGESSANLRSCRCIEQLCITQDRELYDFYSSALAARLSAQTKQQAR